MVTEEFDAYRQLIANGDLIFVPVLAAARYRISCDFSNAASTRRTRYERLVSHARQSTK